MPPTIQAGTAFLWRPTALRGEASDLVRVLREGDLTLGLLANGFECGYSACWPPAARLMLDLFTEAWRQTPGPTRERLLGAFATARQRFITQAPALRSADADFPDQLPAATLLVAAVEGGRAHLAWIGGDVAIGVRGVQGRVETRPHSLWGQHRSEHPTVQDPSGVPNVILRTIDSNADDDPPDELGAELAAGDTLVLLSRAAWHGPAVRAEQVAAAAARSADPTALAQELAQLEFANPDAAYAAVAVLHTRSAS